MVEKYVTFNVILTEDAKLHQGCRDLYQKVAGADRAQHVPHHPFSYRLEAGLGSRSSISDAWKHFLKNDITKYHAWYAKVLQ